MLAGLCLFFLGAVCGRGQLDQNELMRQLTERITLGMPRTEVESTLDEMSAKYLYVPRSHLEAMGQGTFGSTPLSGRIQVDLPPAPSKRIFHETVGWALIDLDEAERVVSLRFDRGDRPR
jgi:hypothetical protein